MLLTARRRHKMHRFTMDDDDPWLHFRALFDAIEYYEGYALRKDVLDPWLAEHGGPARRWLGAFANRSGSPIPPASIEELWALYAFSRANDTLLLTFQSAAESTGRASDLSLGDYADFMTALGFQNLRETEFSPFFHEIVTVEQAAEADATITVAREYWPALMLGDMMFSRGGVAVNGGPRRVRKDIAETSTMYWAFRRRNRRRHDLSLGWGSNSQWRTEFRRDYRVGRSFHFNVDRKNDLSTSAGEHDGLDRAACLELLLHRCFVTMPDPREYCFPYDDAYQMTAPE
jgi:hypothetical protein